MIGAHYPLCVGIFLYFEQSSTYSKPTVEAVVVLKVAAFNTKNPRAAVFVVTPPVEGSKKNITSQVFFPRQLTAASHQLLLEDCW